MAAGKTVPLLEIEKGFRDAALRGGNILFTQFLSEMKDTATICPECGAQMKNLGGRGKNIVSLLGEGEISRNYYGCKCGHHILPKDELLDIANTSFTPGVRRVVSQLAACDSFERSSATLEDVCGIYVSGKDTERIAEAMGAAIESEKTAQIEGAFSLRGGPRPAVPPIPVMYIEYDGTGVPVMKREVFGRKGKQEDGTAKTREAKLGCIFTQTATNEKGEPVREKGSTTYFGAIETSDSFSRRLYMEAVGSGVDFATKVVVLGDGAKWIWNLAKDNFPDAVQIVDLYHAREHLWEYIKTAIADAETQATIKAEWLKLLDDGKIDELTAEMNRYVDTNSDKQDDLEREVNYFKENASRMKYAEFKKQGLFVGSGVIEAGCKNVIGKRLKQSGMHWSVRGANAIIALRCAILSGKFKLPKTASRSA
ncbi:MAG: ISKra4 family transposase [Oscillospiraceae bacterium]|nr:ISKra4 family transposase [Oscillospiraceae bacterium]